MRQDFDSDVPAHEQARRLAGAKQPGRKHQKRAGTRCVERRRRAAQAEKAKKMALKKKRRAAVKMFWAGKLDVHPGDAP